MMEENMGRVLADEKYSKKKVTRCKDSHCIVTVKPDKE
jgi:hypothetical protein